MCIKRDFLLAALLVCAAALPCAAQAAPEIRLLYVGAEDDTALLGARQGLEEANLQGRFLDQLYRLDALAPEQANTAGLEGAAAVLAAVDARSLRKLAAAAPGVPIFNLKATDDSLREQCAANLLHVIPAEAMERDAEAQWRKMSPGANVTAHAWHADFMKFAGRDLNKRYRAATGKAMDDYAWAGWAAVKMVSDSIARLGNVAPASVLDFLRGNLTFDGQKGAEMSFRGSGQLRQPMLLTENGKLVGEAPVRGVAGPDDLDTLGNTGCR
jgi:hypothetical protein